MTLKNICIFTVMFILTLTTSAHAKDSGKSIGRNEGKLQSPSNDNGISGKDAVAYELCCTGSECEYSTGNEFGSSKGIISVDYFCDCADGNQDDFDGCIEIIENGISKRPTRPGSKNK